MRVNYTRPSFIILARSNVTCKNCIRFLGSAQVTLQLSGRGLHMRQKQNKWFPLASSPKGIFGIYIP